jgi:hypothetical protein
MRFPRLPSSANEASDLELFRAIVELGEIVFGAESFCRFLMLPHPIFNGKTPSEVIERGDAAQVYRVLAAEYEGIGF